MKTNRSLPNMLLKCALLLLHAQAAHAATWYVATNGNDAAAGTSWATAKQTIQAAIDVTTDGDTVLVSNGVYATGGRTASGWALTNRVAITNAITVRSVNGPAATVIEGVGPMGAGAIRCAYVGSNAVLSGFTLTKGATRMDTYSTENLSSGGGARGESSARISNCVMTANSAFQLGGGVSGATLYNCELSYNSCSNAGGGAYASTLNNCKISKNRALYAGGAYSCELVNCLVTQNSGHYVGGTRYCALKNCAVIGNSCVLKNGTGGAESAWYNTASNSIIYFNVPNNYGYIDIQRTQFVHCCTTPKLPATSGPGNITNDPRIVSFANPRLLADSPCINAGSNAPWMAAGVDTDGEPRLNGGRVDIGADEFHAGGLAGGLTVTIQTADEAFADRSVTRFDSVIEGRVQGYVWTFGDGGSATNAPAINYSYGAPGDYPVVLTASNLDGSTAATLTVHVLHGDIHVAPSGDDANNGYGWTDAKRTLLAGVDATPNGGRLWASNGIYASGGRRAAGALLTNRVFIERRMSVRSVNGPSVTVIEGSQSAPENSADPGAGNVRGVWITNTATLAGFTIRNGSANLPSTFPTNSDWAGGGVWCTPGGGSDGGLVDAVISNCILSSNSARYGGGVRGGALYNCALTANRAGYGGGGAYRSILHACTLAGNASTNYGGGSYNCRIYNSVLSGNRASRGGGCKDGELYNCVLSGNYASSEGGGAFGGSLWSCLVTGNAATLGGGMKGYVIQDFDGYVSDGSLHNCTVAGNSASLGGGCYSAVYVDNSIVFFNQSSGSKNQNHAETWMGNSCTIPLPPANSGTPNISSDPQFVNRQGGDFRLAAGSPCINTGANAAWMNTSTDMDGKPRILGPNVDMGAYEFGPVSAPVALLVNPAGAGSVAGAGTYMAGTQIQISAKPNAGWLFTHWTDGSLQNPRTIVVPVSGVSLTANFTPAGRLVVQGSPQRGGFVTGDGWYPLTAAQTVISATPHLGWALTGWQDADTNFVRTVSIPTNGATYTAYFTITGLVAATQNDFDGDASCDIVTYVPSEGSWAMIESSNGTPRIKGWGWTQAIAVAADYDGDGRNDLAAYVAAEGSWYISQSSSNGALRLAQWGWTQAIPVPADYDGDGKADLATYVPSSGQWAILQSSNSQGVLRQWGWSQAIPVAADYDGDGRADVATYVPSTGQWAIRHSSNGQGRFAGWGWSQAMPVPADYDGDGKTDLATYVPAEGGWYVSQSSLGGALKKTQWGWAQAIPVAADYDGDGKADLATYHPPTGVWYILSSTGGVKQQQWGWSQAVPVMPQFQINRRYFPTP